MTMDTPRPDEKPEHQQIPSQLPMTSPYSNPLPLRTAASTPVSASGLYSPTPSRHHRDQPSLSLSESNTPAPSSGAPFLHPLQHRVRETHKALIDSDITTGRKVINQYEVIEEIGRGVHGKVKLARDLRTGENVAIKIIPRFSKKRRLGKVTAMSPQDKTKKEIAILKKIRHENVVALLEVIDDPELKKIYMVLEHVELGEIVWRKKGLPHVCQHERRRVEREMRGEPPLADEQYNLMVEKRHALKELKRAKMAQHYSNQPAEYWSVEHGAADEHSSVSWSRISSKDDFALSDDPVSRSGSPRSSRAPSRRQSVAQSIAMSADAPSELDDAIDWTEDLTTPQPLTADMDSRYALDGTMYGAYVEDGVRLGRSPSMADSIISHMSSIDYNPQAHDPFADDYSYVPCFTFDQARSAFRDTVLGLEYLHYQGVVHRDIKPANLLWSKDHRVKISDFGVSYFGRPIRDGEADDLVSESEAKDFDDDLELAKTVGTPAFFAPELCYTDLENLDQPKVSEQIDVWSLGVTLYCLVFARIPFLAEDEFKMFKRIATEDVYIPRRRLAPVDPSTSPSTQSLYKRQNVHPYRDDNVVVYEDVDNLLYDLLRLMLTRNPEKRIRLRDIKRHPWVVQGISNPIGWLDDTDPARPSQGRRIQVDEREMSSAVVPLTLIERARSAVRKAVGKVMHPLGERSNSRSRRRAASSAASSVGDGLFRSMPTTPQYHSERRSIFPDDYFPHSGRQDSSSNEQTSTAVTMIGDQSEDHYDPLATLLGPAEPSRGHPDSGEVSAPNRTGGSSRLRHRSTQSQNMLNQNYLTLGHEVRTPQMPNGHDGSYEKHVRTGSGYLRLTRDSESPNGSDSRSHSRDGSGVFNSLDKRAHPQVGLVKAVAPGSIHGPPSPVPFRHAESERDKNAGAQPLSSSPLSNSPRYHHSQPQSDPDLQSRKQEHVVGRPLTAHRTEISPGLHSPGLHTFGTSPRPYSPMKSAFGKRTGERFYQRRPDDHVDPASVPCPPSPNFDKELPQRPQEPSRVNTLNTVKSSSTESVEELGTPLTCPSETTSPTAGSSPNKKAPNCMLAFQSDQSLPALSGASSSSADLEGELLGKPGTVSTQQPLLDLESSDSLTPPALSKEPIAEFPMNEILENGRTIETGPVAVQLDQSEVQPTEDCEQRPQGQFGDSDDDDDDGSGDDFLQIARSSRRKNLSVSSTAPRKRPFEARRRDTAISNISTASDETARRVVLQHNDET